MLNGEDNPTINPTANRTKKLKAKVRLIFFNPIPGFQFFFLNYIFKRFLIFIFNSEFENVSK